MLRPDLYFDHAATSPLNDEVRESMLPWLGEQFGNPHSLHPWGESARAAVEGVRERLCGLLGRSAPEQIIFTSGATEANNWLVHLEPDLAISPFEHSSIRVPALHAGARVLENSGYNLRRSVAACISVMAVNNETGACLVPPEGPRVHRDITQALGTVPLDFSRCEYISFSAHKCGGPQGVGVLTVPDPYVAEPLLRGGEQEHGLRAGTLNVAGIVGLGAAVARALDREVEHRQHLLALRTVFLETLDPLPDWHLDPQDTPHSPHIVSICVPDVLAEALVLAIARRGMAISSGAACSSRSDEPSAALTALGYSIEKIRGTFRVSFGASNTLTSSRSLGEALIAEVNSLRQTA